MKQFARIISKPNHMPEDTWLAELQTCFILSRDGNFIVQSKGVFANVFIDMEKLTIICCILQLDHADQEVLTETHQKIENFIKEIQTP